MTAHTPGPWPIGTWRGTDDYGWTVDLGGDQRIVVHAQSAESEANGTLIAAAPDLLEALLAALKEHGKSVLFSSATLHTIENAIAKATGEGK